MSKTKYIPKPLRAILRQSKAEIQIKRSLLQELGYYIRLPRLGRPNAHLDKNVSVGDRMREKLWWWLTDRQSQGRQSWVDYWIDEHPVKNVGTKNLSYREAWLEKTLSKIPEGKKILDAGAGELQYRRFCKHLDYVSQDFAQYEGTGEVGLQMGAWDNTKLDIISDITDIPVEDKSFDAVMCVEVFEHIPKPIEALAEFKRIIKPGGTLVITAPVSSLTHFAPYYFYNGYSRYFYETHLAEQGFEIVEMDFNGNYFEYVAQELRRMDEMSEKYAGKTKPASYVDTMAKQIVLSRLEALSREDTGSSELLAHGIHILAVRK